MTRANIVIITKYFPRKTFLEIGSDGYPESVVPALINFLLAHVSKGAVEREEERILYNNVSNEALIELLENTYASIGGVGNFSYAYEVNLDKGTITTWDSRTRWINAPENWEARGWSCWKGNNGKFGYTTWVKGKRVFEITLEELLKSRSYVVENKTFEIPEE